MLQTGNGFRSGAPRAAGIAIAAASLLIAPVAAQAAQPALVLDGGANWGVKQSFRNYVTTTAMGSYEASDGATKTADGSIDWTPASGTVGPAKNAVDIGFGGLVHFEGHQGQLDVKLSDIRLQMNGETGTLFVDAESKSLQSGQVQTFDDVDFAAVSAAGVAPVESTDTTEWGPLPMTLTENGAAAFAGFYQPGTALDPISFTVEKTTTAGAIEAVGKQKVELERRQDRRRRGGLRGHRVRSHRPEEAERRRHQREGDRPGGRRGRQGRQDQGQGRGR